MGNLQDVCSYKVRGLSYMGGANLHFTLVVYIGHIACQIKVDHIASITIKPNENKPRDCKRMVVI